MSAPARSGGWLVEQLPRPLAEDPFSQDLVRIFEEVTDSLRWRVDDFRHYLDVGLAPASFVRWMAGWLGLTADVSLPDEHLRRLVRAAGRLVAWRGTKRGLGELLEELTASRVEIVDGGGVVGDGRPSSPENHVVVRVGNTGGFSEGHLARLVELEIPAHASLELWVGGRRVSEGLEPR